jgi:hypothetical protein
MSKQEYGNRDERKRGKSKQRPPTKLFRARHAEEVVRWEPAD